MIAGYTWAVAYAGVKTGRAREARERDGISPKWVEQTQDYLRRLLTPPPDNAGLNDMVVLPQEFKDDARKLLYGAPGAAERREKLRRRGY